MSPTLLLDLDGTLIDSVPDLAASLNRLLHARGLGSFPDAEVARFVGDGVPTLLRRAFAARGTPQDAAALPDFLADYGAHAADTTRMFPGVAEGLASLRRDGWRLAICTNKPQAATLRVIDALGLAHLFAAIAGGDRFAVRKPDPGHLGATLAEAGGAVGAAVMVGDHRNDVAAAAGLGVPCIFAAWGYGTAEMAAGAAATATAFAEVPALAAGLLGT